MPQSRTAAEIATRREVVSITKKTANISIAHRREAQLMQEARTRSKGMLAEVPTAAMQIAEAIVAKAIAEQVEEKQTSDKIMESLV